MKHDQVGVNTVVSDVDQADEGASREVLCLSPSPVSREELKKWIRGGLEIFVCGCVGMSPIQQPSGRYFVQQEHWSGIVLVAGGIVIDVF